MKRPRVAVSSISDCSDSSRSTIYANAPEIKLIKTFSAADLRLRRLNAVQDLR